jgi:hypothetical protein
MMRGDGDHHLSVEAPERRKEDTQKSSVIEAIAKKG